MQQVNQALKAINPHQRSQTTQQSERYSEPKRNSTEQTFIHVWRGLQAGKYVAKSELVDGTEYKFWRHQLADLSDEQLMAGLIATRTCDVEPYKLTWSKFRQLCLEATKREASHQQFKALPVKAASKETREHYMANIRKLLA